MSCKVTVFSPKTGEEIESKLWKQVNNEVLHEKLADHLFSKTRTENFLSWFGDVYKLGESHSQVVNEHGEPMLVYHSSDKNFDEFNNKFSAELGFHFGTEQAALERHSPWVIGDENTEETPIPKAEMLRTARRDLKSEMDTFEMYPVFLNIRNMIEGVDYLSAEKDQNMSQEEYDYLSSLGGKKFSNEFQLLVIAFHQKGSITREQAIAILSGNDKNQLRVALGNPDGYWYTNTLENKGEISYVVFDENNIKSLYNVGEYSKDENIFYQKESSKGIVVGEKTIRDLAARLADRIGMSIQFEADLLKKYKGKVKNNTAYINLAYATLDTTIHEILGHPIIRAIKNKQQEDGKNITKEEFEKETKNNTPSYSSDTISEFIIDNYIYRKVGNEYTKGRDIEKPSELYQNLLKELETGRGKEVLDRIIKDYDTKFVPGSIPGLMEINKWGLSLNEFIQASISTGNTLEQVVGDVTKNYLNVDHEWLYFNRGESEPEFPGDYTETRTTLKDVRDNIIGNNNSQKYTLEEQQEEAIVELLGLMTAGKLDNVKDGKLISLLKRLLKEMKAFMKQLLGQKEVEIDKLPDNMTLGDLSDLLAYSNNKLILPGNEVIYTTPDNQQFKTYQEASNHISELAKNVKDVDLDKNISVDNIDKEIEILQKELDNFKFEIEPFNKFTDVYTKKGRLRQNYWARKKDGTTGWTGGSKETLIEPEYDGFVLDTDRGDGRFITKISDKEAEELYYAEENKFNIITRASREKYAELETKIHNLKNNSLKGFIEKNKEYEQSKEIIEEWKKVNNIQYNPEEIYSRGQEFVSVVGAYSNFDVNLMMQNLLSHIEDNEKANNHNKITSKDKIVFGHPTIGKSFLKNQGDNKFISLDDDYANEVNVFIDNNRGSETRQEYKGRKPKEYNEFMLSLFDRLKLQAKKEGKKLFVSNTNILKERMSEFDKVITIPKDEFKKRFDARGATYGFEDWKSDIDITVAKVDKSKVISTTGYLSDLFSKGSGFAISAYTKPIDKQIGHLEGGGGKIKFKLYPQSQDILWAANTDVYSGSVWDASEKVNKDKKSELLGVSYTKYPSLRNVNTVQPNLAAIVDDLAHHHNELGISLTGSNFRLEYDEDIPYTTKKIINSINSILDQKYGKLVKPEIKKQGEKVVQYGLFSKGANDILDWFDTKEEAQAKVDESNKQLKDLGEPADYSVKPITKPIGIQPTQTNETLKESIDDIKIKITTYETALDFYNKAKREYNDSLITYETKLEKYEDNQKGIIDKYYGNYTDLNGKLNKKVKVFTINVGNTTNEVGMWQNEKDYDTVKDYIVKEEENQHGVKFWVLSNEFKKEALKPIEKPQKPEDFNLKKPLPENYNIKEYTEQALINTKISKLKEVAKKYPRILIRSEVRKTEDHGYWYEQDKSLFEEDELPFQKITETDNSKYNKHLRFGMTRYGTSVNKDIVNKYADLEYNQIQIRYENGIFNLYKERDKYNRNEAVSAPIDSGLSRFEENQILKKLSPNFTPFDRNWQLYKNDLSKNEIDDIFSVSYIIEDEDDLLLHLKQQGYYKSIPENLLGILSKNSVLSRQTKNFQDRWYFVRGLTNKAANINDNIERYNRFMSMNNLNRDMFTLHTTQSDGAPYLTLNDKFNLADTIEENTTRIHKEKYESIINFFADKFGISKDRINYVTKTEFKKKFPEVYKENAQSVYYKGKFYFFTNNLTSDITVEELLHPFIYTVKEINPQLFDNLLKEAQRHYPKLNAKIQALYANRTKSIRDQELVTQALSRVFNDVYENEEPTSFLEVIKDFIYWLRNVLNDLFKEYSTGKKIRIPIDKLPVQTSLYEIAKILNATDTQLDVIFPEDAVMYSLEENTGEFNKIIENILTDQRVATKVNEIFVKLPEALKNIKNKLNNTINENEKKNLQGIINNIHELENEENQNLIAFQLKGIVASVQLSNELIKNLNAMSNSEYDDNIKLSYYMSVYKTAKAMDGFKELIIELKDELSSNLVLSNTKDINTFIGMLGKAISSEDEISFKIQKLVKTPLLNKLVESNEYTYKPKLDELNQKIADLEKKIADNTVSQKDKDTAFNTLASVRKELQVFKEKAPTRENLEKILNGIFKDANVLSHIFESKIANGNPLVATLQNIINNIYDEAGQRMLFSKNEAQEMLDKYSKATNTGLRDMDKKYEQIRDIVAIPTNIKLDDDKNPLLNDSGAYQFDYVNQDTLLSNIDNSYITQYLELQMIKDFYFDKHKDNIYNNKTNENIYKKYKESLNNFQKFINENSEKEYTQEIYDFKSIMDEVIDGKTLREITGDLYHQLDEQYSNLEAAPDSTSRENILLRIKDIYIEIKRLKTEYYADGTKKEGNDLKIAQLLSKYNKLRYEYYESSLSDSAKSRYEFDKEELEKKKQQYIDSGNEATYRKNLSRIQEETISPDYFDALKNIGQELNELNNVLADIASKELSDYYDKDIFKNQKKDIYEEIKQLSKPYRDEDGVIDGATLTTKHPEVGLKIKDLQQYLEDLKYETSKIGNLSIAESNELDSLRKKEFKNQEEQDRLANLTQKQRNFLNFKKQNEDLLTQINALYKQLDDLSITYTTDYYDTELENRIRIEKSKENIINQAKDFLNNKNKVSINGVIYEKGIKNKDQNVWYQHQLFGKKLDYIPLNDLGESGQDELLDIAIGYLASESVKLTDWWKNNHFQVWNFNKESKVWDKQDRPIYIWEHQSPKNPNFIETKPSKQYYKFTVKDQYINKDYKNTYRGIPLPKTGKFENERYKKLKKDTTVFEFLNYFTNKYLDIQSTYEAKGNSVKMGYVLPAVIKTSGENQVNNQNKLLSFDGTFSEMFKSNVGVTDTDTSYLIGGSQSNNKTVPIRFVGKIDTKQQTKNIVASILLFEYHSSLYRALNNNLPLFEASQLIASNTNVLESKNYADKLSFPKKIFNTFFKKTNSSKKEEETFIKNTEKSVLSKSIDDVLDIFVYGQRMKPQILNLGVFGNVDLSKISSGILGFAAKTIFVGNVISAINNSLSTRLQVIINSGVKSNLYSLTNLKNAQAKAPKYTKNLLMDWTKLGNKSLIGQVLDYFSFLAENPSREITSKSEFTALKNKVEFLTSPKQMSEFEVLFIQFLTMADATSVKVNGVPNKLSNIEEIFELENGKLKLKDGVEFSKDQERSFRGKFQSVARKVAGAYRTTEISSIETNWAGKSGMFLRRYFVGMATNRFQGTRFSIQEGDVYTGYQREVIKNIGKLFKEYKGNVFKYWDTLSDKEKGSHIKMLTEYGLILVFFGLFSLLGGDDDKKQLKENSWAYNMQLVALLRAKTELQQFTLVGIDDLIRVGKNPFMVFQTLGNITKTISLIVPTVIGDEDAYYKQGNDLWSPIFGKFHEKGDSKLLANFLKIVGHTGASFSPSEYIVNFKNAQNR